MNNNNELIKPIIFTDMDGTLYGSDFKVMKQTKSDIEFALSINEENFISSDFNLCTGNPITERTINIANELKAKYIIGSTGAQIYDVDNNKIVVQHCIDNETTQEIIEFSLKNNIELNFFNEKVYYYAGYKNQEDLNYTLSYHFDTEEAKAKMVQKYTNQVIDNIVKIESWCDPKYFDILEDKLKTLNVSYVKSNCGFEIMANNVNKGTGIQNVLQMFYPGHELENVFCAGDSNNDLSMFEICGYSYAMANSPSSVQTKAKYHTSSVEQNGLGEAIIDYLYRLNKTKKKYLLH
ncbi:Cof-type HAD-IIB family hydrolase [Mycoplasma phocoenae]|uniref:Cof-type HAD-IIB family hydrolase n=1 Tax=Mycoplasma phocoenae TaxID=754517 RepID=A0A858U4F0_9MOLU|nr:Cof-type HAD-IIB family hydrolase [Mycoplasma phocoenae]QJG66911.1 Cof-type HAD-IIB family hydrolase [Mycoplasma phocoenae]